MKITIELLSKSNEKLYNDFLLKNEINLLYTSVQYKNLLESYLKCDSKYFIALSDNIIVGVFPLMILLNNKYGNIINSLPYYGSNGGIVVANKISDTQKDIIRKLLIKEVNNYIENNNIVASTFITNPLDSEQNEWFKNNVEYDFIDKRIGQITRLPEIKDNIDEVLLKKIENPRPRNIRKAIKSEIKTYILNDDEGLEFLYNTHKSNIEAIGGLAKKRDFFKLISRVPKLKYNIFVAEKDGKKISALLLFYFNKTVEYYTPATIVDYRNYQPASLIIFNAMKDAISNGYKYWNWGGTWLTQDGVYNFKKKWGAEDFPYYYYTKLYNNNILKLTKDDLLKEYSSFYVIPFDKLK